MSAQLLRMLTNYRRQEQSYRQVLELARDGVRRARAGDDLAGLQEINLRKRRLLQEIARLERGAGRSKLHWTPSAQSRAAGLELEALLSRISNLIEQILHCEQETDLWILQGAAASEIENRELPA